MIHRLQSIPTAYVIPIVVIILVITTSGYYAIFQPSNKITINNVTEFFSIFNGYTEDSGNLLLASFNTLNVLVLIVVTTLGFKLLIKRESQLNAIFILMLFSQLLLTYTIAPRIMG